MPVDLLERTLELPKKSSVVTQPYVDFLTHQYQLSHNGAHGIEHWLRVLINGRLICQKTGADLAVVEHFALLHDVKRYDENRDIDHGARAAEFANNLAGDWVHLDRAQLLKLTEAIRFHSHGRLSRDPTIQACWDSDRVDLGRIGERPDPSYLGTRIARDPEFLREAMHRAKRRFVNYDFSQ